ncbi:hypothetical protein [Ancylobacter lacus]|uniref:hypothetical protein n=1 Tax=Ancylobacter lacus TaxID=2579970 RepID=UPI001BCF2009|nr:hypothetical protein [Ancylobacter lacus]MBS7539734.1 hypothetical protein [Ancylobacter lacus]
MLNSEVSESSGADDEQAVRDVVACGPHGALTVAGLATAIVVGLWLAFYLLVFLPRGALQ